jgi:hypothetical protein
VRYLKIQLMEKRPSTSRLTASAHAKSAFSADVTEESCYSTNRAEAAAYLNSNVNPYESQSSTVIAKNRSMSQLNKPPLHSTSNTASSNALQPYEQLQEA